MAAPTAAQMIEQLKARPIEPPTRGFGTTRQLIIEEVEVVRPSLSLDIRFDFDSAKVRPESRQALQNLAKALVSPELLSARFAVEGHTDAKGRADYNQKLSQLRAEAVRDFLAHQAVEPQRLVASGKGASEPANAEDPNAAENRRVRIVNLN
jgi:outer membrane protein OmpA-like peptidoglycan-associated protein